MNLVDSYLDNLSFSHDHAKFSSVGKTNCSLLKALQYKIPDHGGRPMHLSILIKYVSISDSGQYAWSSTIACFAIAISLYQSNHMKLPII